MREIFFFFFFAHIQIFMFFYKCVCRIFFCVCGSLNEGLFVICKSSGHFFWPWKTGEKEKEKEKLVKVRNKLISSWGRALW